MVLDRLQGGRKNTRIIMDIFGLMMQLEAFKSRGQLNRCAGNHSKIAIMSGMATIQTPHQS
jgi:hypothetical protein